MMTPKRFGLFAVCLCLTMLTVGCIGKVVPPGVTVMIVKPSGETKIVNEGVYKEIGRDRVYFIDGTLQSYEKKLSVLCADTLNMEMTWRLTAAFDVNEKTIPFLRNKIKPIKVDTGDVTGFEISFQRFFSDTLEHLLSTVARAITAPYKTETIQSSRDEIQAVVLVKFVKEIDKAGFPIVISNLILTNINPPKEILDKRKRIKEAELQDEENAALAQAAVSQAKRDAELAAEKGKALLVEAQADAAANDVRAKSLTPEILAMKQLETLVKLAEGTNNMAIVIPYDAIKTGLDQKLLRNSYVKELSDKLGNK